MRGKTNGNSWVPKTLWSHPASQMQLPSIEVWFVRNVPWRCTLDEWRRLHFTGADPGFFLGGGALVSCSASTPIHHIVFFLQNFSCIKKPQVISGRGGGAHPLHSPPRSAPASCLAHLRFLSKVFLLASISSILWRFKSLQCYSLQIRVSRMGRKQTLQTRSLRKASGYTYLLCMALSHFQDPKVIVGLCVVVIWRKR